MPAKGPARSLQTVGTPATANGQVIRQSIQALQACCLASPSHERAFFVYI